MIEFSIGVLGWCARRVIGWVLIYPVLILLAAPFVLVGAVFSSRPYGRVVAENFGSVYRFWREYF